MKKILIVCAFILFGASIAYANDFQTFYNNGQNLYNNNIQVQL